MNSDTPKTDALRRGHPLQVKSSWAGEILDSHEQLERENQQLREECAKWRDGCLVNADNAKDALRKSDERRLDILQLRADLKQCAESLYTIRGHHTNCDCHSCKALSLPSVQAALKECAEKNGVVV